MADLNDRSLDTSITNEDKSKKVTVTTDGSKQRLDVNIPIRYSQLTSGGSFNNTTTNKTVYTIPSGKILYITSLTITYGTDGGEIYVEWAVNGITHHSQAVSQDANRVCHSIFNAGSPLGPFGTGLSVTANRITGDAGKNWSASFTGYLEDL